MTLCFLYKIPYDKHFWQLNHNNLALNLQFTYEIRTALRALISAFAFQRLFIITRRHPFVFENLQKSNIMTSNWFLNFHIETVSVQQLWNFYCQNWTNRVVLRLA